MSFKNDEILKYISITFLFLFITGSILFAYDYISSKNNKEVIDDIVINNTNNIDIDTFTSVEFNKKSYKIPDNYMYEINDNRFIITNTEEWSCNIQVIDKSYEEILSKKDNFKSIIEDYGYLVRSVKEVKYDNDTYLKVDLEGGGSNHILLYSKYSKSKSYVFEVVSFDDDVEDIFIFKVKPIIDQSR